MDKGKAVVITTIHRGVFFGYTSDLDAKTVSLKDVRMAIYWSPDVKGVPGLSATGPTDSCRISPKSPQMDIPKKDITATFHCSDEATKAWEDGPWNS